jgi:hypothetical protein
MVINIFFLFLYCPDSNNFLSIPEWVTPRELMTLRTETHPVSTVEKGYLGSLE